MDDLIIKPRHLLLPEIDYELKIRNIHTQKDRADKIKILNRILEKEAKGNNSIKLDSYDYNFEKEQDEINTTLISITALVLEFEGNPLDSLFQRIKSRLAHLIARINRVVIPEEGDSDSIQKYKNETYATCLSLEADVFDKVTSFSNKNPESIPSQSVSTPVSLPTSIISCSNSRNPISEWNLKFSGDPRKVYDFLERVSELSSAYDIDVQQLFKSAILLFSDEGLLWFRNIRDSISSWTELVQKIKQDFLLPNSDDEIWNQIKSRKQRKEESVTIFISHMQNLFSGLTRFLCESTKVKFIRQNLCPDYVTAPALIDVETVAQLSNLVKRLEEANVLRIKHFSFPVRQVSSYGCDSHPSTSNERSNYFHNNNSNQNNTRHPNSKRTNLNHDSTTNKNSKFRENSSRDSENKNVSVSETKTSSNNSPSTSLHKKPSACKCWNCGRIGHVYNDCRGTKRTFCYKCGLPNVTVKTCTRCSKN